MRSIVDSRFNYMKMLSASASNLSMRLADASSVTITSLRPNYPLTRLLVWKKTLILNSSVSPGIQTEKKQGALFINLFECSVIKLTSKFTSAGWTIVLWEDLKIATTVVSANRRPKKKFSGAGLLRYKTNSIESCTCFVILRGWNMLRKVDIVLFVTAAIRLTNGNPVYISPIKSKLGFILSISIT